MSKEPIPLITESIRERVRVALQALAASLADLPENLNVEIVPQWMDYQYIDESEMRHRLIGMNAKITAFDGLSISI